MTAPHRRMLIATLAAAALPGAPTAPARIAIDHGAGAAGEGPVYSVAPVARWENDTREHGSRRGAATGEATIAYVRAGEAPRALADS
jgi:hypothetical protein